MGPAGAWGRQGICTVGQQRLCEGGPCSHCVKGEVFPPKEGKQRELQAGAAQVMEGPGGGARLWEDVEGVKDAGVRLEGR